MSIQETNKLKPDYFFSEVAKEFGIDKDVVSNIYSKYTIELIKAMDKYPVLNIYGLGRFETNHKKVIRLLNVSRKFLDKKIAIIDTGIVNDTTYNKIEYVKKLVENVFYIAKIKKLTYVKVSFNDLRNRSVFFSNYFDENGNYIGINIKKNE